MSNEVQKFFEDIDAKIRRDMRRDRFAEWFALAFAVACVAPMLWAARVVMATVATPKASEAVIFAAVIGLFCALGAASEVVWALGLPIGRRVASWWIK